MPQLSGSCLCSAVTYSGEADVKFVMNCHCADCQKATGSVHGTMVFVEEDKITVDGDLGAFKHKADSGNELTKLFCPSCGSQVLGKNSARAGVMGLRAGTLDQKDIIEPNANLFCQSAVPSTPMDPQVKQFDKMPS